jgi:hypothetical protein
MSIRTRLERLERQRTNQDQMTFEQALQRYDRLLSWLNERGYVDALAAVEAGENGPVGLEGLLREQAGYDPRRRAWERIEKALDAGELPDDADLRAMPGRNGTVE